MILAIDFDSTCCFHRYPEIGEEVPHCIASLKQLQAAGHKIVLNTMRSDGRDDIDKNGLLQPANPLKEAVNWLKVRGIELYGVNREPNQDSWTSSPKVYANYYIDDAAIGCPIIYPLDGSRPYVDWLKVMKILKEREKVE